MEKALLCFSAAISITALVSGYDIGVINFGVNHMPQQFKNYKDLYLKISTGASVFGAAYSAWSSLRWGKIAALLSANFILVMSYTIFASATQPWIVATSRGLTGFAIGAAATTSPLLVSTVAPARTRGCLVGIQGLFFTLGQIGSSLTNYILEKEKISFGWRWFAIPAIVITVTQFLFFVSSTMRNFDTPATDKHTVLWECLVENYRQKWRQILTAIFVQATKHFAGANIIIFHGPEYMDHAGLSGSSFAANVSLLGLIATSLNLLMIDRSGRRVILIWSLSVMSLCQTFLYLEISSGILPITLAWIFVFFYSFSMTSLPVTLNCEIFGLEFAEIGTSIGTMASSLTSFLVGHYFSSLNTKYGEKLYAIHGGICGTALIGVAVMLPETANLNLHTVETLRIGFP